MADLVDLIKLIRLIGLNDVIDLRCLSDLINIIDLIDLVDLVVLIGIVDLIHDGSRSIAGVAFFRQFKTIRDNLRQLEVGPSWAFPLLPRQFKAI